MFNSNKPLLDSGHVYIKLVITYCHSMGTFNFQPNNIPLKCPLFGYCWSYPVFHKSSLKGLHRDERFGGCAGQADFCFKLSFLVP